MGKMSQRFYLCVVPTLLGECGFCAKIARITAMWDKNIAVQGRIAEVLPAVGSDSRGFTSYRVG